MQPEFSLKTVYFSGVYLLSGKNTVIESVTVFSCACTDSFSVVYSRWSLCKSLRFSCSALSSPVFRFENQNHLSCPELRTTSAQNRVSAKLSLVSFSKHYILKCFLNQLVGTVIGMSLDVLFFF